jgi:hypothetical protein
LAFVHCVLLQQVPAKQRPSQQTSLALHGLLMSHGTQTWLAVQTGALLGQSLSFRHWTHSKPTQYGSAGVVH